jgi:hypothetical protein
MSNEWNPDLPTENVPLAPTGNTGSLTLPTDPFTIGPIAPTSTFVIGHGHQEVVRITSTGEVHLGAPVDEAARVFWDQVSKIGRTSTTKLRDSNEKLRRQLQDIIGDGCVRCSCTYPDDAYNPGGAECCSLLEDDDVVADRHTEDTYRHPDCPIVKLLEETKL